MILAISKITVQASCRGFSRVSINVYTKKINDRNCMTLKKAYVGRGFLLGKLSQQLVFTVGK
jgi:hypothetical protein